jgi:hypothetical protein
MLRGEAPTVDDVDQNEAIRAYPEDVMENLPDPLRDISPTFDPVGEGYFERFDPDDQQTPEDAGGAVGL